MRDNYRCGMTLELTLFSYCNKNKMKHELAIGAFFKLVPKRVRGREAAEDCSVDSNDLQQASISSNAVSAVKLQRPIQLQT